MTNTQKAENMEQDNAKANPTLAPAVYKLQKAAGEVVERALFSYVRVIFYNPTTLVPRVVELTWWHFPSGSKAGRF